MDLQAACGPGPKQGWPFPNVPVPDPRGAALASPTLCCNPTGTNTRAKKIATRTTAMKVWCFPNVSFIPFMYVRVYVYFSMFIYRIMTKCTALSPNGGTD
jgi:hypothetical protein